MLLLVCLCLSAGSIRGQPSNDLGSDQRIYFVQSFRFGFVFCGFCSLFLAYCNSWQYLQHMISIIYGKQSAECFGANCGAAAGIGVSSELNSMIWDTGLGLLPAAIFSNTPIGAVIDQSFYIFPNKGLNTTSMQQISNTVDGVPSVKLYLSSDDISSPELQVIVQKLKGLNSQTKSRTDRLGTLVK